MAELETTLARLRAEILDDAHLVRALATGRRRGQQPPPWQRVELRYVDLKGGRHLQVTAYDGTQAHTSNHADPREVVDDLLEAAWAHWHVDTDERSHQLRVTKRGEAMLHTAERAERVEPQRGHDQVKERLLPEDHPVLRALGIADARGRVKPSRQAKYRQVEELVRALDAAVAEGQRAGTLRTPTPEDPLRVVDLGCGNAYLTFAAHAYLSERMPVRLTGVDVKEQSRRHNGEVAAALGVAGEVDFVQAGIGEVELPQPPDVVLALHACDTATDDALARAVRWQADLVLAAPCCHHDVSAQLRRRPTPPGYEMLTRDGILRERLADTLTDALRASLLRLEGYRVEVAEFVDSAHTPRNTLLRAVRVGGGARPDPAAYDALVATWQLRPALAERLGRAPA